MSDDTARLSRNLVHDETIRHLPGLSVLEQRVFDHLIEHISAEREVLRSYERSLESVPSRMVRYLVRMILEDERRHHALLIDLAETVAALPLQGPVPVIDTKPNPELAATTTQLLALERRDRKELGQLRKELATVASTSLWPLLIEILELDTDKHIKILEFLRRFATRGIR
jgi:hypothetical protein